MVSLFFVFLAATISADNLLAPKNIFAKDPKAFVSTFSRADKETLQTLLDMTNEMLNEGINAQAAATAAKDEAVEALVEATKEHDAAEGEYNDAKAEFEAASSLVSTQQSKLDGEEVVLQTTSDEKGTAQDALDVTSTKLEKTQERVTQEKEDLNKILDLLKEYEGFRIGFTETNRKLLSKFVMVEEDDIDILESKINELITEADKELAEATQANTDAQTTFDEASTAHSNANTAVATTRGELEAAKLQKTQADVKQTNKLSTWDASIIKEHKAEHAEEDAQAFLLAEQTRVAGEKATLDQVVVFLNDLIAKASD